MEQGKRDLLKKALRSFIDEDDLDLLSKVLIFCDARENISFKETFEILGSKDVVEDVLFLAFDLRLLIPISGSRDMQWNHRILTFRPEEVFYPPQIIKSLVKKAISTGKWDLYRAMLSIFNDKTKADLYTSLIRVLFLYATGVYLNAFHVKQGCLRIGLSSKDVDFIISLFKSIGIFSPALGYLAAPCKNGPIYELNPSLRFAISF